MQVFLDKPIGLSFGRGNDSAAYVIAVDPKRGTVDEQVEVRHMPHRAHVFLVTHDMIRLHIGMKPFIMHARR